MTLFLGVVAGLTVVAIFVLGVALVTPKNKDMHN